MATIAPSYSLVCGEEYDPVLINAIFNALTIGAIFGADIAAGTILGSNIASGTITGSNIAAATIQGQNILADAIGASHIASNTISADDIQTDAITTTKILAGAVTTDKIYAGAITSDKISVNSLDAISANLGEVTSGIVTASTVRTSANPAVNRVIMDTAGLRGYDTALGLVFNIYTDGTPPLFASGKIQNATIINTTIVSNDFKTSDNLPWIELGDLGLAYRISGSGGLYGTGVYDTATYGAGVTAYVGNSSRPFFSMEIETTLPDLRLYNRSTNPSGAADIGDLACVSGTLRFCTTAGTPGTYKTFCTTDLYAPLASPTFTGTAFATQISTPSIVTASGALGITPVAGSNLNVSLSTTGDFAVNTNQLYVDTSAGKVGIGTTAPGYKLTVESPSGGIAVTDGGSERAVIGDSGAAGGYMQLFDANGNLKTYFRTDGGESYINAGKVGIGTTNPTNGVLEVVGQVYFSANCSALSYTDRTPFYSGDAIAEIKAIRGINGKVDHSTLPAFAKSGRIKEIYEDRTVEKEIDGVLTSVTEQIKVGEEIEEGRNLGNMVSMLTVAVQQLTERIEELEGR